MLPPSIKWLIYSFKFLFRLNFRDLPVWLGENFLDQWKNLGLWKSSLVKEKSWPVIIFFDQEKILTCGKVHWSGKILACRIVFVFDQGKILACGEVPWSRNNLGLLKFFFIKEKSWLEETFVDKEKSWLRKISLIKEKSWLMEKLLDEGKILASGKVPWPRNSLHLWKPSLILAYGKFL